MSADPSATDAADVRHVIELDLPVHRRHAATVRLVAASLAADIGFTVDEIEDLRVGVSEAASVLSDVDTDEAARLHFRFVVDDAEITVFGSRRGVATSITESDIDDLAVRILRAVVDDFHVDSDGVFVVTKRHATDDD